MSTHLSKDTFDPVKSGHYEDEKDTHTPLPQLYSPKSATSNHSTTTPVPCLYSTISHVLPPPNFPPNEENGIETPYEGNNGKKPSTARIFIAAFSMLLTYYLGAVSGSAIILAIPSMARDLGLTELETQWVSSAYSLAYGCSLLFCGRLADIYGRKLCYLTGLSIFFIFNILSAVIKPAPALFCMRAFAGVGLAMAGPAGFGLIGSYVTHEPARSRVFATFGLGGPIGAATGGILGGAIAGIPGHRSWSYLFYIFAALSLLPMTIAYFLFPGSLRPSKEARKVRLDWGGGFLMVAAVSLFVFSLVQSGTERGWKTPYVPALFVISIVLFIVFFLFERHLEKNTSLAPAAKPSVFTRNKFRFTFVMLSAFFSFFSIAGWLYCATIWYQNMEGMKPLENALHTLPCAIAGIGVGFIAMILCDKVRAPILFIFAACCAGLASMLYAVIPPHVNYWASGFIAQLFVPWGPDFTICVGNVLVANLVDKEDHSVGGALFSTAYTIGSSLGIALSSLVIEGRLKTGVSLHTALQTAFWFNASLAWTVIIIVLVGLRKLGVASEAGKDREE